MNAPTNAAVAVTEQIERLGSYFGFAAVIGIGVLSLLYFAQAREVKRLREWAGRSPERDAELAQRVQSDAQRRVVAQPVVAPRPPAQPGSPATAAAQQADAARKAAAAALLAKAQQAGPPVVGPPGQLDRPATVAGGAATGSGAAPGATPAAEPASTPQTGTAPAGDKPSAPGQPAAPPVPASTVAGATASAASTAPAAATAGAAAAAAAARQGGPPSRTAPFANGAGGQDTHESAAARPAPLPDLPRVPRAVTPAASRLSDDDARASRGPRTGLIAGGIAGVVLLGIVLVVLLTGGSDTPTADNEIGGTPQPPPAASAPTSATKVDRKATQVAVLNGTTQTGLARNVGNKLESSGFTILSVGDNADQQIATTTISYADGSVRAARVVAQIMEVPATAVQPIDLNTSAAVAPEAKVVVVVGSDRSNTG